MKKLEFFRIMAENLGEEAYLSGEPDAVFLVQFKSEYLETAGYVGSGFTVKVADEDLPENPIDSALVIGGQTYYLREIVDQWVGVTKYQVEKVR